jgi:hypothetical protein
MLTIERYRHAARLVAAGAVPSEPVADSDCGGIECSPRVLEDRVSTIDSRDERPLGENAPRGASRRAFMLGTQGGIE